MASKKSQSDLLLAILPELKIVSGPDKKGECIAWCPYHPDGNGKPPHRPNLHVSEKGFNCFACNEKGSLRKLAQYLGLPEPSHAPEKIYDYRDENGQLLYQVVRLKGGQFRQRRPDGNGNWLWNLNSTRRVLYRLPELMEKPHEKVFIVEGEKDADRLSQNGLLATTNSGGAGKWRSEYSETLTDRDVVVIPDNDAPGKKHAAKVANCLLGKAKSIRIADLPGLKNKGDVSDWLLERHTIQQLLEICESIPVIEEPIREPVSSRDDKLTNAEDFHLTDVGNAQRLVARHGKDLRYCHPWKKWLVWDGTRWRKDSTAEVVRRAKETVRSIYAEAAKTEDSKIRQQLANHAKSSESEKRLKSMVNLADSEQGIWILPEQLDRDIWLLNCLNGTLDLRSGSSRNHQQEDMITKMVPVDHDKDAKCPMWESFLDRIMDGNQRLIKFLQRAVGYSLTGNISEQCLFVLYGTGANGKTTFVNTIMSMLGDYAVQTPTETLMRKRNAGIPNDIARLEGARMVAAVEAEEGRRFAEVLLKQLTGGDTMTARFLHQEFFEFTSTFKLWLATNHKPTIRGSDHAIWRRIRLVPFTVTIPEKEQDKNLQEKLLCELSGILRWAIEGCLSWQKSRLEAPEEVLNATSDYRMEMDILGAFISEFCIQGSKFRVQATQLYQGYCEWAKRSGEKTVSQTEFGRSLTERGFGKEKESRGRRLTYYFGLGLIEDNQDDET